MPRVLGLAVVLVGLAFAASAQADTVYLRDGRSFWGSDIVEGETSVVVIRPGEELRFPKAAVQRIERLRTTLPPFYSPPEPPAASGQPGAPGRPGAPEGPGGTLPPGGAPPAAPPGAESVPQAPGAGPVQLPPPPPPPVPGGS
jgi:hypothetical protein